MHVLGSRLEKTNRTLLLYQCQPLKRWVDGYSTRRNLEIKTGTGTGFQQGEGGKNFKNTILFK